MDRKERLEFEFGEVDNILIELKTKSDEINEKSRKLNDFYYQLEETLRHYEIGYNCFLVDTENEDGTVGQSYQLSWTQDGEDFYFWRIGFGKCGWGWNLLAQKWHVVHADPEQVGGPEVLHEAVGDPIRLTHAPRDVRTAATHRIADLLKAILKNVEYNVHVVDSALERATNLDSLVLKGWDKEVQNGGETNV